MKKKSKKTGECPKTRVVIDNEQTSVNIGKERMELLENTVLGCLEEEGINTACEVNILLTDDESIRRLNLQYRNIDAATDVLSFPMVEMENGKILDGKWDYDIDTGLLLLGDVVVSAETAKRQAERYGHSFERELAFLASHGVFHLLGYDHPEYGHPERAHPGCNREECVNRGNEEESTIISRQEAVLEKLGLKRI